ncbi:MAG: helix-turn-helix domain-containing protein [Alphaproteobacteria bacterium]|nr:helix-turn-helix domain-containing protein [Alphaproteobacteria bacterium]
MPTIEQIRAARALIGWSQKDLADHADLSQTGIARIENGTNRPNSSTIARITSAFDKADIEFIGENGVRKRTNEVQILRGKNAMSDFLDDVYETAVRYGAKNKPTEVFLSNVVHQNWIKWMGGERWKNHTDRMTRDKDLMDVRIIVKEGDHNFPTTAYSKYKWIEEKFFNEKSFYSYHDRLAFLNFGEEELTISIMKQPDFAKGYRDLFLIAWNTLAYDPPLK